MSSQPPSNENLSAYFDHEASPEERLELESLLENSAEARRELHETKELSRLLQETATESAPPELAASIRRRIEQETLLTETVPATVKHVPSLLRYRIAVAISTCSSLAALILFVLLMNTHEPNWESQTHSSSQFAFQPAPQPTSKSALVERTVELELHASTHPTSSGNSIIDDKNVSPAPSIAFTPESNRDSHKLDKGEKLLANKSSIHPFNGKFSVRNTLAEEKVRENHLNSTSSTALNSTSSTASKPMGIPDHIPLDSIRIGDVLPYFSNIDGKVAVIEVRVVDVKQALGTMELLLARNNIPVNQKKQSAVEDQLNRSYSSKTKDDKNFNYKSADSYKSENQLFAVYVEATDEQLASALKDFQRNLQRDQLIGLALQPAINASSLTDEVVDLPNLLAQRSDRVQSNKKSRSVAEAPALDLKKKLALSYLSDKDSNLKKSAVATLKEKKEAVVKKNTLDSYQMRYRMQVPAEQKTASGQVFKRQIASAKMNEGKQKVGKKIGPNSSPALIASKPDSSTTSAFKNKMSGADVALKNTSVPVKVLFVFKDVATPTKSPAPK